MLKKAPAKDVSHAKNGVLYAKLLGTFAEYKLVWIIRCFRMTLSSVSVLTSLEVLATVDKSRQKAKLASLVT
jgi:hypothetical protein